MAGVLDGMDCAYLPTEDTSFQATETANDVHDAKSDIKDVESIEEEASPITDDENSEIFKKWDFEATTSDTLTRYVWSRLALYNRSEVIKMDEVDSDFKLIRQLIEKNTAENQSSPPVFEYKVAFYLMGGFHVDCKLKEEVLVDIEYQKHQALNSMATWQDTANDVNTLLQASVTAFFVLRGHQRRLNVKLLTDRLLNNRVRDRKFAPRHRILHNIQGLISDLMNRLSDLGKVLEKQTVDMCVWYSDITGVYVEHEMVKRSCLDKGSGVFQRDYDLPSILYAAQGEELLCHMGALSLAKFDLDTLWNIAYQLIQTDTEKIHHENSIRRGRKLVAYTSKKLVAIMAEDADVCQEATRYWYSTELVGSLLAIFDVIEDFQTRGMSAEAFYQRLHQSHPRYQSDMITGRFGEISQLHCQLLELRIEACDKLLSMGNWLRSQNWSNDCSLQRNQAKFAVKKCENFVNDLHQHLRKLEEMDVNELKQRPDEGMGMMPARGRGNGRGRARGRGRPQHRLANDNVISVLMDAPMQQQPLEHLLPLNQDVDLHERLVQRFRRLWVTAIKMRNNSLKELQEERQRLTAMRRDAGDLLEMFKNPRRPDFHDNPCTRAEVTLVMTLVNGLFLLAVEPYDHLEMHLESATADIKATCVAMTAEMGPGFVPPEPVTDLVKGLKRRLMERHKQLKFYGGTVEDEDSQTLWEKLQSNSHQRRGRHPAYTEDTEEDDYGFAA